MKIKVRIKATLPMLALFAILTVPGGSTHAAGPRRPNVLFIMSDDQGYGDLGCYGATDLRTPYLDQLARDGIRFTDYYANGPTCSPTRAAFLTGRYQQRLGLDNALYYQEKGRGLDPAGRTLAADLREKGYVTGLSGKWHLGYDQQRKPLQQGFDHFFGLLGGNHHYFEHMDRIGVPDLWLGNEAVERDGYTTDLITDDAIAFIRENRARPFFLFIAHAAPHFPWQGPKDRDKPVKPKHKSWQSGDRATYVAMVEHMDAGIGKTLDVIDRLGLGDRTLVVFSSDNGGSSHSRNAPLSGHKSTLWEGGIRVPCIARWPGKLKAGTTFSSPCITMDWTATIRRLAGIPANSIAPCTANDRGRSPAPRRATPDQRIDYAKINSREEGIDLMPLLTGKQEPQPRSLFWRRKAGPVRKIKNAGRAVRRGDWKLIETAKGQRYLFNLKKDIGELNNLIDSFPKLARELGKELDVWEASVDGEALR